MILASLKYARRNLLAVQEGFEVNLDSSWAVTNERAVNVLPSIASTEAYFERLCSFCRFKGLSLKRSNKGRGIASRSVVQLI